MYASRKFSIAPLKCAWGHFLYRLALHRHQFDLFVGHRKKVRLVFSDVADSHLF